MSIFNRDVIIKEEYDPNDALTRMMDMVVKVNAIKRLYGQEEIRSYAMTGQGNTEAESSVNNDIDKEINMQADFISNMKGWMQSYVEHNKLLIITYSDDSINVEDQCALDNYLDKNKYNKIVNYQYLDILIKLYWSMNFAGVISKSDADNIIYQMVESYADRVHFPETAFTGKTVYEALDSIFRSEIIYTNADSEQYMKTAEYLLYSLPKNEKKICEWILPNEDRDLKLYVLSLITYLYSCICTLYKSMIEQFIDIAHKIRRNN